MGNLDVNYGTQEGKEELLIRIQELYGKIFKFAIYRRDAEDFLGIDVEKDNMVLQQIIAKLTAKLQKLSDENGEVIDERKIIAVIDSLLELINFEAQKGPVDDQFLSEIRQKCHEDNVNFGKKFESADRLVALLATIEVALETFTGRYLNMVIFGLTSYLSEKMNQADDVGPYESEKVDQEARLNARTFFTNVPHLSPQLYAAVNRMRSKVLSVSVLFATLNVFTDMYLLQPHQQEVVVDAHDSQNATLNRGREIRNFIESISGVLRMALVCLIVHRLINARVNQHFIDYASFLLLKLEDIDKDDFDPKRLKPLRALFLELQHELRKMHDNPQYDPSEVIHKIHEGIALLSEGKDVQVKDFLKDARKNVRISHRKGSKKSGGVQASTVEMSSASAETNTTELSASPSIVVPETRKKVFHVAEFRLPPLKKELTREQRMELYARRKALEDAQKADSQSAQVSQTVNLEETNLKQPSPKPAQVETLTEREKMIQKISFPRMLDRSQFKSFLIAMGFEQDDGGKGSHEKYVLRVASGELMVILSQNFDTFGDPAIKSNLLKKQPEINPQWVYWVYCRHFDYPEALKAYEEIFGQAFDRQNEPSHV